MRPKDKQKSQFCQTKRRKMQFVRHENKIVRHENKIVRHENKPMGGFSYFCHKKSK